MPSTTSGDSDTPVHLVMLPGMDGTEILFAPLLAALPEWVRVQVVTYPNEGENRYEDLLPHVVAAVTSVPNCYLFAWSFSGPLAVRAAVLFPDRVRGVILGASFVQPPNGWLSRARFLLCPTIVGAIRFLRRLPLWLGTPPNSPLRRAKAELWRRIPARTLAARARAIAAVDVREVLRGSRMDVLYLAAADDRVVRHHNGANVQRLRPDTKLVMVPGGHFALFTHAPAVAAAVVAFVRR